MLNDLKSQLGHSVQAVRSFFDRPIHLGRGSVGLGVPDKRLREQAREARQARTRRMQADLNQLMQQHPGARSLMRHLALVEHTLRHQGLRAMQALPVRVLAKALAQLETLVWDWSQPGLADLRSRLAVIVKTRASTTRSSPTAGATLPKDQPDDKGFHPHRDATHGSTEVTELDHAAFEEMERSWAGQMPNQPPVREVASSGR